jgi:hypothetical protein
MLRTLRLALCAITAAALAGCASLTPPKPWEKGELAKPEMQFDSNRLEGKYTEHIYDSKEKASGGVGVGGGGCGCN